MDTGKEYNLRLFELKKVCEKLKLKVIYEEHNKRDFLEVAYGLEDLPEGGNRCKECFKLRLERTANKARELKFDYFATTLTVSPLKNADLLNSIGHSVGENYNVKYLPSDFKKRGGYQRSVELSKEYNLYRQSYCGCEFSK
jgi:predicted adenine nucleotide alpha hydrolase (AANH) superfamily ATPase